MMLALGMPSRTLLLCIMSIKRDEKLNLHTYVGTANIPVNSLAYVVHYETVHMREYASHLAKHLAQMCDHMISCDIQPIDMALLVRRVHVLAG